jgi:hypothetical protein
MKKFLDRLTREPNLVTGAITATFNMLVLLSIIDISNEAVAGINVAIGAWFILIRQFVTPSNEVIAQQKPGKAVRATSRAAKRWGIQEGTVVKVNPAVVTPNEPPSTHRPTG